MKKEKLITRTIALSIVNFKFFDMDKNSVEDSTLEFSGKMNEKDAEEEIKDIFEYDFRFGKAHRKLIVVNSIEYAEKLYGVSESAFLEIAHELPPRKVNESQEDD